MFAHPFGARFQHGQAQVDAGLGVLGVKAHGGFGGAQGGLGLLIEQLQPGQAGPSRRLVGGLLGDGDEAIDQFSWCHSLLVALHGLLEQGRYVC